MTIATIKFHSDALGRITTYTAIIPDISEGPYSVLVQLHGLSDDHTAWITLSRLVEHAAIYPFLIVMPDGGSSAYRDLQPPLRVGEYELGVQRFERYLVEDLMAHVRRCFRVDDDRWAIGGHSMGGYGAMRLACKHPDRFLSVWAHSGAYHFGETDGETEDEDGDLFRLLERIDPADLDLAIGFDCGTADPLLRHSRRLRDVLQQRGIPHLFTEHPGGHDWSYWDRQIVRALAHHAEVFARRRGAADPVGVSHT